MGRSSGFCCFSVKSGSGSSAKQVSDLRKNFYATANNPVQCEYIGNIHRYQGTIRRFLIFSGSKSASMTASSGVGNSGLGITGTLGAQSIGAQPGFALSRNFSTGSNTLGGFLSGNKNGANGGGGGRSYVFNNGAGTRVSKRVSRITIPYA